MKKIVLLLLIIVFTHSCKSNINEENTFDVNVPVTVTTIDTSGIISTIDLNATATYLVKNVIKANATGYLNTVNVKSNDYVTKGEVLFSLKTRESKVLGNTVNKIDPALNFGGAILVKAAVNGYISNISVQKDDYVQDGDQLAVIYDASSFAFVLSLPYDLKKQVALHQQLAVFLPDGTETKAVVQKFMPNVDVESQTQNVILKCLESKDIPENLVVKVRINKASMLKTISVPKEAVLSDETETHFWIMKMINENTAIKVPIQKGISTVDRVAILAPKLTSKDRILVRGNYGVSDTIHVTVEKKTNSNE